MLVKLPLDVWRDVFDFLVPTLRKELALKFNGTGDREFQDICQKWLHEWVKDVRFGRMMIDSRDDGLARLRVSGSPQSDLRNGEAVPIAESDLPTNIRGFKEICLSYLDNVVLRFLRQMQPLFWDVHLRVDCAAQSFEVARAALDDQLMPLLTGGRIESARLPFPLLYAIRRHHFPVQFLGSKRLVVQQMWELDDNDVSMSQFMELIMVHWLGTRRADGQPRVLILDDFDGNVPGFEARIRQHFRNATEPASFFIWIRSSETGEFPFEGIHESTQQNGRTNEQLVVRMLNYEQVSEAGVGTDFPAVIVIVVPLLLIGRCPCSVDGRTWVEQMNRTWLEEMSRNEANGGQQQGEEMRQIMRLSVPGPIVAEKPEEKEQDAEEEEAEEDI